MTRRPNTRPITPDRRYDALAGIHRPDTGANQRETSSAVTSGIQVKHLEATNRELTMYGEEYRVLAVDKHGRQMYSSTPVRRGCDNRLYRTERPQYTERVKGWSCKKTGKRWESKGGESVEAFMGNLCMGCPYVGECYGPESTLSSTAAKREIRKQVENRWFMRERPFKAFGSAITPRIGATHQRLKGRESMALTSGAISVTKRLAIAALSLSLLVSSNTEVPEKPVEQVETPSGTTFHLDRVLRAYGSNARHYDISAAYTEADGDQETECRVELVRTNPFKEVVGGPALKVPADQWLSLREAEQPQGSRIKCDELVATLRKKGV